MTFSESAAQTPRPETSGESAPAAVAATKPRRDSPDFWADFFLSSMSVVSSKVNRRRFKQAILCF
jgi:hypothetical protein